MGPSFEWGTAGNHVREVKPTWCAETVSGLLYLPSSAVATTRVGQSYAGVDIRHGADRSGGQARARVRRGHNLGGRGRPAGRRPPTHAAGGGRGRQRRRIRRGGLRPPAQGAHRVYDPFTWSVTPTRPSTRPAAPSIGSANATETPRSRVAVNSGSKASSCSTGDAAASCGNCACTRSSKPASRRTLRSNCSPSETSAVPPLPAPSSRLGGAAAKPAVSVPYAASPR